MNSTIAIEKVHPDDAEKLLEIYGPYVRDTAISFEYDVPSIQEFTDRIRTISEKYPYIKAVKDGEILGYAYANHFKERRAYDWSVETTVYVRQDCRRMGIGKILYEQLEESLRSMGILNLNACIAKPVETSGYLTDDSIRFHENLGFSEVGCFHDSGYKFDRWFDMVWMEKMIGEHSKRAKNVTFGSWDLK